MIRGIVERLSRDVVLKRRLPSEFARRSLYVSPDSALSFWTLGQRGYDPVLLRFVRHFVRASDVVIDAGANVGIFTFAAAVAAGASGHVIAIDADEWLVGLLRRSARLGERGEADVTVIAAAVAAEQGVASFTIAARGRASSYLTHTGGNSQAGGARETRTVITTTLDVVAAHTRRPNVLKVDLEGAEVAALQGGRQILAHDRPIILCEVDSRNRQEVAQLLGSHDYVLFDAESATDAFRRIEQPAFNTIACPRDRVAEFPELRFA